MEEINNNNNIPNESLSAKIERLIQMQEKAQGEKKMGKFKLPWGAKLSKANIKKNYVNVIYIKDNKDMNIVKLPIEDETVTIDGLPRVASSDYVMLLNGKPTIIQPSWSIAPFNPTKDITETEAQELSAKGRRLVFAKMKNDIIAPKKMGGGMMIWIILGLAVLGIGYYLMKGGKLF